MVLCRRYHLRRGAGESPECPGRGASAAFFRVRWFLEFPPPILRPPESPAVIDFPNSRGFQFPAGNVRIPERRRRRRRPKNSRARRGGVRRGRARIPEYYGKGAGRPAPHGGAGKAFFRPPVGIRRVRGDAARNTPARRLPARLVRRAVVNQQFRNRRRVAPRRQIQRRPAVIVFRLDLRAVVNQQFRNRRRVF